MVGAVGLGEPSDRAWGRRKPPALARVLLFSGGSRINAVLLCIIAPFLRLVLKWGGEWEGGERCAGREALIHT